MSPHADRRWSSAMGMMTIRPVCCPLFATFASSGEAIRRLRTFAASRCRYMRVSSPFLTGTRFLRCKLPRIWSFRNPIGINFADKFFNDAYWFDQAGCSSPRLVAWCGEPEQTRAASADFFPRVAEVVRRRRYALSPSLSMRKLVFHPHAFWNCLLWNTGDCRK